MKTKSPRERRKPVTTNGTKPRARQSPLHKECQRLRQEVKQLQAERDQCLKALHALTRESIDFDKKKLLSQVGKQPSLREFIAELQAAET